MLLQQIANGVMLAYQFQIVRHTANGEDDFPGPGDFRGVFDDVVIPALKMLFGVLLGVLFYLHLLLSGRSTTATRAVSLPGTD